MLNCSYSPNWYDLALLFFLYAEIHYRIFRFPGRLFQRLPELIADAPFRLEPNQPLPILVLAKDANTYPITLERVWVEVRQQQNVLFIRELLTTIELIQSSWWERIFFLELPDSIQGELQLDVRFQIRKQGKSRIYHNDNYCTSSHSALQVLISAERLPCFAGQYYGDLHFHSHYTSDQVEFGASLRAAQIMAQAIGLAYFAVTDHSYDLDDKPDNFLHNDLTLKKWSNLQQEIQILNQQSPVAILAGEEVSARNQAGLNVHFLIFNTDKFYAGSGDSAEVWLQTRSEWSITEILNHLDDSALAIAAHPYAIPMRMEKLLLGRDFWHEADAHHPRLNGLQILNGLINKAFKRGIKHWRRLLLTGRRLYIYAGNDAHGNFNRYRQVKLPFWNMLEHDHYVFGKMRTVIMLTQSWSLPALWAALRAGQCYVTNGPALDFCATQSNHAPVLQGQQVTADQSSFQVSALSTAEFGTIRHLSIFYGDLLQHTEKLFLSYQPFNHFHFTANWRYTIQNPGYFRVEVETATNTASFHAYSNPIWVQPRHQADLANA